MNYGGAAMKGMTLAKVLGFRGFGGMGKVK